jgi:hypothetical protein
MVILSNRATENYFLDSKTDRGRGAVPAEARFPGWMVGRSFGPCVASKLLAAANRYIAEVFLPEMNRKFAQEAAQSGSAFVGTHGADLDRIFAICYENRLVANDNTVRVNNLTLQIEKSPFRQHFAKCRVDVWEHLDDTYSVVWQKRVIGRYGPQGQALGRNPGGQPPDPRSLSPLGPEKRLKKRDGSLPPASSPAVFHALGSLSSVALSSQETISEYGKSP